MPRRLEWYPRYVGDYLADTWHLTREQDYAYMRILDDIFWNGQGHDPPSIPDDLGYLLTLCKATRAEWDAISDALFFGPRALLEIRDGRVTQKRMTHEIKKALGKADVNRQNAQKRWKAAKRPSDRAGRKKSGPDIATHAERADRGATGRGNGNGANLSDDRQYLFIVTRAGKWIEDHAGVFAGDVAAFEQAFAREIGISWSEFQRLKSEHSQPVQ